LEGAYPPAFGGAHPPWLPGGTYPPALLGGASLETGPGFGIGGLPCMSLFTTFFLHSKGSPDREKKKVHRVHGYGICGSEAGI